MGKSIGEKLNNYTIDNNGCWVWQGTRNKSGYGMVSLNGRKTISAHRVSYEYRLGVTIPEGLELDHLCYNRPCINPAHLEPVTHKENKRRSVARQTHCKRGHPRSPENNFINAQGGIVCRPCRDLLQPKERVNEYNKWYWHEYASKGKRVRGTTG